MVVVYFVKVVRMLHGPPPNSNLESRQQHTGKVAVF